MSTLNLYALRQPQSLPELAVVMNFITFESAYCLFPKQTFEEMRNIPTRFPNDLAQSAIEKYITRGWRTLDRQEIDPPNLFNTNVESMRFVGDKRTWRIKLEKCRVNGCAIPSAVDRVNRFRSNSFNCLVDYSTGTIDVRFRVLKPTTFAYRYTASIQLAEKLVIWLRVLQGLLSKDESKKLVHSYVRFIIPLN